MESEGVTLWRCGRCHRLFSVLPPQTEAESRQEHQRDKPECGPVDPAEES